MTDPIPTPPRPEPRPVERTHHGDTVVDPYSWLREKDDPAVVAHLEAENAHTEAATSHLSELREQLFEEIKGRVQETDLTVPVRSGPWWYFARTTEGSQYAVHCRVPARGERLTLDEAPPTIEPGITAPDEQVLLDENILAGTSDYFALGAFDVSPDHRLLAYSTDHDGSERYTLRIRDLEGGADLPDEIPEVTYGTAWSDDGSVLLYVKADAAQRPYQLWRHVLGSPVDDDVLVHQEDDEHFFLGLGRTKDDRYVVLHLGSKVTDEVWVLPGDDLTGEFAVVEPREHGVEYSVEHQGDRFVILTNADGAENFELRTAPDATPGRANWEVLIPHDPEVKLGGVDPYADHLVVHERRGGLRQIRVLRVSDGHEYRLEQPEEVSTVGGGGNAEYDTTVLRYGYTSMVTPSSVFDVDLVTGERVLRKQQPVLGGYDPDDYVTERLWATADDGTQVPISIVARRDRPRDVPGPALLYGYGSYEASMDPGFSSARLSLLDRGFAFAIAHIRGGGEMGRRWYLDGKELAKRNTFTDFVACARHLVDEGWTTPAQLGIRGGSAGGLLMGAVVNLAPDLFGAVIAEVPFVDALNTILDPSLPLTVTEWEEWGNPLESPEVYDYMKSYAPYENVEAVSHPAMLVTAGLNDPRVSYWEPAKWVARLRETTTGDRPILLKTEMGAGHQGPSGRYDAWRDEAFVLAFLIDQLT
ncbi:S9 family peptidase [Actinomarinicola tropica]|uniref:S9 family peptidase n=1 Tax=Actinomarinicola tropica TaxID=2789776 RepID=UPI001E5CDBFC|nr:S9 family peptidase [Actinomarinicola tropica]